jgi:hypothetical protein
MYSSTFSRLFSSLPVPVAAVAGRFQTALSHIVAFTSDASVGCVAATVGLVCVPRTEFAAV